MAASNDVLYVGTGGGFLLTLNCSTMELYFFIHAYNGPLRTLLLVSPLEHQQEGHSHIYSKLPSEIGGDDPGESSLTTLTQFEDTNNSLRLNLKPMEPLPSEQSVLISFGRGYRGVVGDSENCPQEFILPSAGKKVTTTPAKPDREDGHLLLWSTEHVRRSSVIPRLESSPSMFSPRHNQVAKI